MAASWTAKPRGAIGQCIETEPLEFICGRLKRGLAMGTIHSDQPLGHDTADSGADQERLASHIHQAGEGAWRVIGMDGGKDKVAGKGGLQSNLCCFFVPDLPDHNDVRVLAQDGSKGCRKGHLHGLIHLNLCDTIYFILYRVFNGCDVDLI